jgi:hypothetical protein
MTAEERLAMREKEINECHTCQRHKELEAEVAKLRKAIEDAPHEDACGYWDRCNPEECHCWKKEALA